MNEETLCALLEISKELSTKALAINVRIESILEQAEQLQQMTEAALEKLGIDPYEVKEF